MKRIYGRITDGRFEYAELESEKPEARPDPTINTDGKPKVTKTKPSDKLMVSKRRKRRAGSQ